MGSYGSGIEVSSKVVCGVLAGIMMIAALCLPLVNVVVEILGYKESEGRSWSSNVRYFVVVGVILLAYFISLWLDWKWMMILPVAGMGYNIFEGVRYFFEVKKSMNQVNDGFDVGLQMLFGGDSMVYEQLATVKFGIGFYLFIAGCVIMIVGICIAHRE